MVIKSIKFPSYFEILEDDDNTEGFVEFEDGYIYTVVLATPKNIKYLMYLNKMNYFGVGYPTIILKSLTKDIIIEAIKAYADDKDGYWIKWYHFAGDIDTTVFDKLQAEDEQELFDEELFP
jgi:hypothetical protein